MLIQVKNLDIQSKDKKILDNFCFTLYENEVHALIGESGSGKSTFGLSLLNLNKANLHIKYEQYKLLEMDHRFITEENWLEIRGKKICLIPQNPSIAFHPYMKILTQIEQYFQLKNADNCNKNQIVSLLETVGILDVVKKLNKYPSQLSGGERQRILIAMAVAIQPSILIADEPTTALDSENEKIILKLLYKLTKQNKIGLVLITHDMRIVRSMADRITVLYRGKNVESLSIDSLLSGQVQNKYTRLLIGR